MKKSPINYEQYGAELKRKANFFANKIWGINFTGNVEFSKGQKVLAEITYYETPTIRFKMALANPDFCFCVDDLLVGMLTRWYCHSKGLKKEKDYLEALKSHGICSTDNFFINNMTTTVLTGSIEKRPWEPTIKLIDLVLECEISV
jgi:hypothetical protein